MFGVSLTKLLIVVGLFLLLFQLRRLALMASWVYYEAIRHRRKAKKAEDRVGRELTKSLLRTMPPVQESRATRLVREVGGLLAADSRCAKRRFEFQVVESRSVNACAIPGGFVFVTNSLLELCHGDRDEVAFVVAHEMEHLLLCHVRDRFLGSVFLFMLVSVVVGGGGLSKSLRRFLTDALTSAFSQEQELQADRKGVKLLTRTGFDGDGAVRLLTKLLERSPSEENWTDAYFSAHPPLSMRISAITEILG